MSLFRRFPRLVHQVPWRALGVYPTPVQRVSDEGSLWVKREDLSSGVYGGNKVRIIEGQIGLALSTHRRSIWATGAFGSNHALATALHAPRVGLEAGAALFPQPPTKSAQNNLQALIASGADLRCLWTPATLPMHFLALSSSSSVAVMTPGAATPRGVLGPVSAGLELASQVRDNQCPLPDTIVIPVGSTCTCAGVLIGVLWAANLGLIARAPAVLGVAVGPWPITSKSAVVWLAKRTLAWLEELLGRRTGISAKQLEGAVSIDRRQLGRGYGHPTAAGHAAREQFATWSGPPLDLVYSAKAAASALSVNGTVMLWSTKSSAPLPEGLAPVDLPWLARRWLNRQPLDERWDRLSKHHHPRLASGAPSLGATETPP